jgi:hypothetical protein
MMGDGGEVCFLLSEAAVDIPTELTTQGQGIVVVVGRGC